MSRLSKSLAALSVLIFFVHGIAFASMTIYGPSEFGLPQTVKVHGSPHDGVQIGSKTLQAGLLVEEDGEMPILSKDLPVAERTRQLPFERFRVVSTSRIVFAPKVSTYIFQSVLNL